MKAIVVSSAILACLVLSACQGKKAQLEQLQAEYKTANTKYNADCVAPAYGAKGADAYFKGVQPKAPNPQEEATHNKLCAEELTQVTSIQQQIVTLSK